MKGRGSEKLICLACSTLSGLLLILLFPLWGKSGLAWVALIPLLWLIRFDIGRHPLFTGWWTGIIFFHGLLYWLARTMVRFGGMPLILSQLSLLLLCLYLGLYIGAFSALLKYTYHRIHVPFCILAPTLWIALEWVRSYFLTGFPWGLLGYSQVKSLYIVQMADLAGVYGISFLIVFTNALLTDLVALFIEQQSGKSHHTEMAYKSLALGLSIILVIGYGALRLHSRNTKSGIGKEITLGLVQANIPQEMKRDITSIYHTLTDYGETSLEISRADAPPELIIWPETAFNAPVFPGEGTAFLLLSDWAKRIGTFLLLGCPRYDLNGEGQFNSAFLFSPTGDLTGIYDKIHLVPFGEYFPFQWVAKSLGNMGSFLFGEDYTVFDAMGSRFSVVICFESIFPDLCRRYVREGAGFLINLTNDAWFGKTAAPYQHFDMACMRAVENRVWLVRVANTGITAIVDPWGNIVDKGGIFERLVMTGRIYPAPIKSIYASVGYLFAWLCFICSLLWCIVVIKDGLRGDSRHVQRFKKKFGRSKG